jgi:hypothetical protein
MPNGIKKKTPFLALQAASFSLYYKYYETNLEAIL